LHGADVANLRIDAAADRNDLRGQADVVTMRAVRADSAFFAAATVLMRQEGLLYRFGSADQPALPLGANLKVQSVHELRPGSLAQPGSVLTIFQRTSD
jgi:hypothetical protein